jgi:hypothetical protein
MCALVYFTLRPRITEKTSPSIFFEAQPRAPFEPHNPGPGISRTATRLSIGLSNLRGNRQIQARQPERSHQHDHVSKTPQADSDIRRGKSDIQ